jgi:hypothetical protein
MTAILYFGEMFIAPLLAMVLLAISPLKMTSAIAFFAGGGVNGGADGAIFGICATTDRIKPDHRSRAQFGNNPG